MIKWFIGAKYAEGITDTGLNYTPNLLLCQFVIICAYISDSCYSIIHNTHWFHHGPDYEGIAIKRYMVVEWCYLAVDG